MIVLALVATDTGTWQKQRDRDPRDVAVMNPGWPLWRWGEVVRVRKYLKAEPPELPECDVWEKEKS